MALGHQYAALHPGYYKNSIVLQALWILARRSCHAERQARRGSWHGTFYADCSILITPQR